MTLARVSQRRDRRPTAASASPRRLRAQLWLAGCVALSVQAACVSAGRFPLAPPLWEDPDQIPFAPIPEEYESPMVWDVGDQSIFYPLTRVFAVDPAGESVNVNALDEVPDSSWFENRIGRYGMSPADAARGPCPPGSTDPPLPWTVTGAKPNGANPGFMIKDASGQRHLVKFDGTVQGPRATAADVIVSKLYHAAGYWVPCNRVVFFDRAQVHIGEGAESEAPDGDKEPLTEAHLDQVYAAALRLPDGRYRASTSQFLPGKPLGPFTYQGLRDDDPNDVVPHQDRRELRGMRLLAAWTQHFDAREQNTLAMWMSTDGDRGYVRHNVIDFGDCFGSIWEPPALGRRLGHSYYFDLGYTIEDWLTLGLIERPWDTARFGPSGPVFGYISVENFDPERWRPGYPNPAFVRMSERDGAWMARLIAELGDGHLRAVIAEGKMNSDFLSAELFRLLAGRRERILERYLTRLSPLSHPALRAGARREICLRDLVVESGLRPAATRRYAAMGYPSGKAPGVPLGPLRRAAGDRVCLELAPLAGARPEMPRYLSVDLVAQSAGEVASFPARVHLYDLGAPGVRIVGLERPASFEAPD